MVVVTKVGPAEPACFNNPITGELITNNDCIKSTSLAHCVKILTKNPIRECDQDELDKKEENHRRIMEKNKTDPREYTQKIVQKGTERHKKQEQRDVQTTKQHRGKIQKGHIP